MKIVPLGNDGIAQTCKVLQKGGVVVFPSDTVYGLLCDASNIEAVILLQKIKNRPAGKPISVFVADIAMMKRIVRVYTSQEKILHNILPGPYTVVLPSKQVLCRLLESEKGTLGIRIPSYQPITQLIHTFNHPVTATSANTSGHSPFYSATSFLKSLSQKKRELIDLVVDGGDLPKNKPSTVLDFSASHVKMLRRGDVSFKDAYTVNTSSEDETKKVAEKLLQEALQKQGEKPVVFVLKGEMGVGKTIFAKGIGKMLGIGSVISPTYVIYYEYTTNHPFITTFIHCDFFNIEEENEFEHLKLQSYFKKGTVLCFEWGEKAGALLFDLQKKAHVVVVSFTHKGLDKRELQIESYFS